MNAREAEQYLLEIPRFTKKNPMENTRKFIDYLGEQEPENVIHVAGTNGKGSVCAFLNEILTTAGYRVGMFTSPHLVSMTERFRINGEPVSEEIFVKAFSKVKEKVEEGCVKGSFAHPTFFEFLMGMACVIFSMEKVDYIILETGMGGRLDATNIIKKPLACVITSIGMDHTEYLGDTLEAVAKEKAGIIKEGVPVIYDANKPEVSVIIEQKARKMHAKTYEVNRKNCEIVNLSKKNIDFLFHCEYYNNMWVSLETLANYQIMNAALAAVTIHVMNLNYPIPESIVAKALGQTRWPGRMEWLNEHMLIDGAHNEDGVRMAVRSLNQRFERIVLLYSTVKDKEYRKIIQFICESMHPAGVVVTELDTPRAVEADELMGIFKNYYNGPVYAEKDISRAVRRAEEMCDGGIVFGTGSLYLVGELLKITGKSK